ncbi:MAG TPA: alkaline phosphatase family protein [Elusimicrobiota bacterium]|nr:alkaline phosphatase family protein [Elusimicrobiota bacterium]
MTRVLIAGLDSIPPELFFDHPDFKMPFVRRLMSRGVYGEMVSCDPPITVPAWAVLATGKEPKELGVYGFRERGENPYSDIRLASSTSIKEPAVWDYLGRRGRPSVVVGVPPAYPPRRIRGPWVSCLLTPSSAPYATPPAVMKQIESWLGARPRLDAEFRREGRASTLAQIYETSRHKFEMTKRLLKNHPWDFAMFVDIGPDRMHHAFWKFFDKGHPGYRPGNEFERAIPDYYGFLDRQLESLFGELPADTAVLLASDHGSKRMNGCFCVNEWLLREGYLKLKRYPEKPTPIESCDVDWPRTRAWGWGGYYARIFINVKGREPAGAVSRRDYEPLRRKLARAFRGLRGPGGEGWKNQVLLSDKSWRGQPPDLLVYLDDLGHRSAGTLGHNGLYLRENDTGPDDAVHARNGFFWLGGTDVPLRGRRKIRIIDIAPTVLKLLGHPLPRTLRGKSIL